MYTRSKSRLRTRKLLAICSILAGHAQGSMLSPRYSFVAATCTAQPNLTACPAPLPFCCGVGTTCIALNSDNSAVLCCPPGTAGECGFVTPIGCNASLQNQTETPYYPIHASTPIELQPCGTGCCPPDYSCTGGQCQRKGDLTTTYTTSSPSSSTTTTPSSTSSTIETQIPTATPAKSTESPVPTSSGPSSGTIAGGLVGGLIAAIALTLLIIWLFRKRRERKRVASKLDFPVYQKPPKPSLYVSAPMQANAFGGVHRTEFLMRQDSISQMNKHSAGTVRTSLIKSQGRRPLYPAPLRYGLPVNPLPPRRPARSGEYGGPVVAEMAPVLPKIQPSIANLVSADHERQLHSQGGPYRVPERQHSGDSYISTGSSDCEGDRRGVSTHTIDVLMPPAHMTGRQAVTSDATTWDMFMKPMN